MIHNFVYSKIEDFNFSVRLETIPGLIKVKIILLDYWHNPTPHTIESSCKSEESLDQMVRYWCGQCLLLAGYKFSNGKYIKSSSSESDVALLQDAIRYRWLREDHRLSEVFLDEDAMNLDNTSPEMIDALIDEAMLRNSNG